MEKYSVFLFFFLSCSLSLAQMQFGEQDRPWQQRRLRAKSQCHVQRLNAQEPSRKVQSEAGLIESWDQNDEQFDCAGVAAFRHTIQPNGLLLPSFSNAPALTYIIQGNGIGGTIVPGCSESFHSIQQSEQSKERKGMRFSDQHQKIIEFKQGDVIATPAGVSYWCYNDGKSPIVTVTVLDTSNHANQLDQNPRKFQLAGSRESSKEFEEEERSERSERRNSGNIFSGFDTQSLAEALGVSSEIARKLQGRDDRRGEIIRVERSLQVIRPSLSEEEETRRGMNGLEEVFCNLKQKTNIDNPAHADVYSPRGGRITTLNSQKLQILRHMRLSAERGILYRNAVQAPHWNINAHSVVYITRGRGRIQVVGDYEKAAFNDEVCEGQMLVIPQNFAVLKQAENEGLEWISFKTNDNAMTSPLVGKSSVLRALPEDILMNSYRLSREEARMVKNNRADEMGVFSPSSGSKGRASSD